LEKRAVYVGVARLLEQRPHDASSFEDVATAPRFEERHDVTEVFLMAEIKVGMAFVEASSGLARARAPSDALPFGA
jgi:hypothetical protein